MSAETEAPTQDQTAIIDKLVETLKEIRGTGSGPKAACDALTAIIALRDKDYVRAAELISDVSYICPSWQNGSSAQRRRYQLALELRELHAALSREFHLGTA